MSSTDRESDEVNSSESDHECEENDSDVDGDDDDEAATRKQFAILLSTRRLDSMDRFVMDMGWDLGCLAKSVKQDCLKIYHKEKEKRRMKLMNLDGQISLSVEILRCAERKMYMRLNAHFVDDKWKLNKWIISNGCIHNHAIRDSISEAVMQVVSDWGIRNKISTVTYEQDWFDKELLGMLKDRVQEKRKLHLGGRLFCLPCCTEVFKSMVKDVLKGNQKVILKIEELWCSGESHLTWKCTYEAIKDTFEAHQNEDSFATDNDKQFYGKLSPEDWDKVKGLCQILEVLYCAAKVLFQTKRLTPNICLHNFQKRRVNLMKEVKNSDSFTGTIAKEMLQKFEEYFNQIMLVLSIATVLDPRYKMKYIEFSSMKYEGNDGKAWVKSVLEAMHILYDEYMVQLAERENSISDSTPGDSEEGSERPAKRQKRSDDGVNWLSKYNQFVKSIEILLPVPPPSKTELELYLEEPVIPWKAKFDILSWWKVNGSDYPVLSRIARDVLPVPLSCVTGYDAYWITERQIEPLLKAMEEDLMNVLTCTQNWFQKR